MPPSQIVPQIKMPNLSFKEGGFSWPSIYLLAEKSKMKNFRLTDTRLSANFFLKAQHLCFASYDIKNIIFVQPQIVLSYCFTFKGEEKSSFGLPATR